MKPQVLSVTESTAELKELAKSAGAHVIKTLTQRLPRPTQVYVGKGKLDEIRKILKNHHIDTVICDDELTPTQQRNLEVALQGVKVIDRTALILHVFAGRTNTREGRLQVELAQHEYMLPRLAGQWTHLERLGGGIGTRGPGETQIETDRQIIRTKIQKLKKALNEVSKHRNIYRKRRKIHGLSIVSLVGYTNAGKSTLFNKLTGSSVRVENKLFSTLDPVTRKIRLPNGTNILITDTVGFIQKLPTSVVAAFKATLEEIHESDMILHVIELPNPNAESQVVVVEKILEELDLQNKPRILVLNKIDLMKSVREKMNENDLSKSDAAKYNAVFTSATTGEGLDNLTEKIYKSLRGDSDHKISAKQEKT